MVGCITCYGLFIVVVGCITHLPKKSKQSSVKRKSLNDVGQQSLEKVQVGTHILHQAMKGNDVVVGIHKSKQQEKWKPRPNTSDKGMSLQILSFYLVFT